MFLFQFRCLHLSSMNIDGLRRIERWITCILPCASKDAPIVKAPDWFVRPLHCQRRRGCLKLLEQLTIMIMQLLTAWLADSQLPGAPLIHPVSIKLPRRVRSYSSKIEPDVSHHIPDLLPVFYYCRDMLLRRELPAYLPPYSPL